MHSNGELLGTLCGKRQDAALVWIINILLHSLACISRLLHSWAAFSLAYGSWKYHAHSCNNSRYCMLTRVIRYIYSFLLASIGKTLPTWPVTIETKVSGEYVTVWYKFTRCGTVSGYHNPSHGLLKIHNPSRFCWVNSLNTLDCIVCWLSKVV